MKNNGFARVIAALLCMATVILIFPVSVRADLGPKPSVQVSFVNLGDELCYATLLTQEDHFGPYSAWDGIPLHAQHSGNDSYNRYGPLSYDVWKAFVDYAENDEFVFLQEAFQINESKKLNWWYWPPDSFKVVLYFPETEEYAACGRYERYAFDSYFTIDVDKVVRIPRENTEAPTEVPTEVTTEATTEAPAEMTTQPTTQPATVDHEEGENTNVGTDSLASVQSYDYGAELGSFAVRMILTIAIEIAVALLFGYRAKKQLLLLAGVNAGTQLLLNVLLNLFNSNTGAATFVILYAIFELMVFALEAAVYYPLLHKFSQKPKAKWMAVVYAAAANAGSFGAGILLAQWLTGIF